MTELSTLGSVIKLAYEAETDTNGFTDAEKTKVADEIPSDMSIGNVMSPLYHLPLKNSLVPVVGVGDVTFNRAGAATHINRYGVVVDLESGEAGYDADGIDLPPARTNQLLYSDDFSNAVWLDPLTAWSVTATTGVAPDGTSTANEITASSANPVIRQNVVLATGSSASFWFKRVSGTFTGLTVDHGDGTAIDVWSQIGDVDEWAEIKAKGLIKGAAAYLDINVVCESGAVFEIWRGQFEALLYSTPGIKTEASPVARLGATATFPYAENFPGSLKDKTVVFDINVIGTNAAYQRAFSSGDLKFTISQKSAGDNLTYISMGTASVTPTVSKSGVFRFGATYDSTTSILSMFHDGVAVAQDLEALFASDAEVLITIGSLSAYIKIKNLKIYDRCLTENEMRLA